MRLRLPKFKKSAVKKSSASAGVIARMLLKAYTAKMREAEKEPKTLPVRWEGGFPMFPYPGLSKDFRPKPEGALISGQTKAEEEEEGGLIERDVKKGLSLPTGMKPVSMELPDDAVEMHKIDIKYPLIPSSPKRGEKVFAYAHIVWDDRVGGLVYNVVEPRLTTKDKEFAESIKRDIEERLDINFSKIGEIKAKELLNKEVRESIAKMPGADPANYPVIQYHIEKDLVGLGVIEPLMRDPEIEDVSCDGEGIPIYVYHRNPRLGSIRTNLWFENKVDLDSFVLKLAQKCGKSISVAEPLLDAALPDGSRVQCTMGTDIARRGSNFTIRKFTAYPLTPTHMIYYKTLDSMQLAYLWLAIEHGKSILVSGGTATGKTSLLNALSLFIKPDLKILSIEDTPELRLPHTHWVPEVARSPLSVKGKIGEVTLFDLLKSSLRQRPDYLVVGEVRGREAFVMFQQIATGHPSIATMHAASLNQLVDRLMTPPISLPPTLIENIDIIIFLQNVKIKNRYSRRVNEVLEVIGIEKDRPVTAKVFEWSPLADSFVNKSRSKVLEDIARVSGYTEEKIQGDILRRKRILDWMFERKIFDYNDIGKMIGAYYSHPERLMASIEESG